LSGGTITSKAVAPFAETRREAAVFCREQRSPAVRGRVRPDASWIPLMLLLFSAIGIPASLIWDFSWESTIGVDLVWAPPHLATYAAILVGCIAAFGTMSHVGAVSGNSSTVRKVRVGGFLAPLGSWVVLWGGVAFVTATLFDRWWLASYGLVAGIWHPPQLLKATAFFAVLCGVWMVFLNEHNRRIPRYGRLSRMGLSISGGMVLAMVEVMLLVQSYPNRQHAADFFQVSCAVFPAIVVAIAVTGAPRLFAAGAALWAMGLMSMWLWVLPLFPATPRVSPVYQPLDHMMPPPFPLLLVAPALAVDLLLRLAPGGERRKGIAWRQVGEIGFAFFAVFTFVQWNFASFLLSSAADHWFFAGGGKHWPFFLPLDAHARTSFWGAGSGGMDLRAALIASGAAIVSSGIGLWLGASMKRLRV